MLGNGFAGFAHIIECVRAFGKVYIGFPPHGPRIMMKRVLFGLIKFSFIDFLCDLNEFFWI